MDRLAEPLTTLGLTIAIELAVVGAMQRRDWRGVLIAVVLVNCATQPVANACYRGGVLSWLLIECAVIAAECVGYRLVLAVGWRRAVALSCVANTASAAVGLLIFR